LGSDKLKQLFGAFNEGFVKGIESGHNVARIFGMELALAHITPINREKKEELQPGGALAGGAFIDRGKGGGGP